MKKFENAFPKAEVKKAPKTEPYSFGLALHYAPLSAHGCRSGYYQCKFYFEPCQVCNSEGKRISLLEELYRKAKW